MVISDPGNCQIWAKLHSIHALNHIWVKYFGRYCWNICEFCGRQCPFPDCNLCNLEMVPLVKLFETWKKLWFEKSNQNDFLWCTGCTEVSNCELQTLNTKHILRSDQKQNLSYEIIKTIHTYLQSPFLFQLKTSKNLALQKEGWCSLHCTKILTAV